MAPAFSRIIVRPLPSCSFTDLVSKAVGQAIFSYLHEPPPLSLVFTFCKLIFHLPESLSALGRGLMLCGTNCPRLVHAAAVPPFGKHRTGGSGVSLQYSSASALKLMRVTLNQPRGMPVLPTGALHRLGISRAVPRFSNRMHC